MKLKTIPLMQKILFLLVFIFVLDMDLFAQCSVCRASAESSLENGEVSVARGLNKGILYLMAIPYLVLMSLFFYFFKKQIMERIKLAKDKFLS